MSVRRLDTSRYRAIVYGDETNNPERPKKFLQDGIFFDGAGVAIDGTEVKPPAPAMGTEDPIKVVEQPNDRAKLLVGYSLLKLRSMAKEVSEASGVKLPAMSGAGVTKRLIKYITDNTE
jgi:hypothetical protein